MVQRDLSNGPDSPSWVISVAQSLRKKFGSAVQIDQSSEMTIRQEARRPAYSSSAPHMEAHQHCTWSTLIASMSIDPACQRHICTPHLHAPPHDIIHESSVENTHADWTTSCVRRTPKGMEELTCGVGHAL